ncbi:MAG: 2-hydroxyacyl-CoA dehydratase [Dehalococcoidales bacterium]|nr:MAG: 2-hydroxyacyl-CoA dehydratase [Dehalococcoidales bacterium]
MAIKTDFDAKPLSDDVWGMMKDLRRERNRLGRQAMAEGAMCITGFAWGFLPLLQGFGDFANPSPGANFTRISREGTGPEGLSKYVDIATGRGLSPVCGAIGAHMGQFYFNVDNYGNIGPDIHPDFVYQPMGCHALVKGAQLTAEVLGLPILNIDGARGGSENGREYLLNQLADAIEWIEKQTGRKFDDEKFIEATVNTCYSRVRWAETAVLMKNVPAPMSYRQAMSLRLPLVGYSHNARTREYTDMLYEEIQQRVKEGISASPFERKRLMHEGLAPMYDYGMLRWPEKYGGAYVWGGFVMAFGAFRHTEDGHTIPAKSLEEQGIKVKTREDALRVLVDFDAPLETGERRFEEIERRRLQQTKCTIEDFHIDGVMQHLARRCAALNLGIYSRLSDLRDMGVVVGTYEASEGDPNEWNEARVREDYARFFENLGLTEIEGFSEGSDSEE